MSANNIAQQRWARVGCHIIPAEHVGRMVGGSTDKKRDKEEDAHLICIVDGKYQDNDANANLIVAAPELYDMVGKLMRVIEGGIPDLEDVDEYQMAVTLLAKIDGGAA